MRINALEASGAISEQVRMGSKTKRSFSLISQNISMGVENFYVGDGCLKCVIYNLFLPQRPQIKWNLSRLTDLWRAGNKEQKHMCQRQVENVSFILEAKTRETFELEIKCRSRENTVEMGV